MRADVRKNEDRLLATGLATLYRHFPTRGAAQGVAPHQRRRADRARRSWNDEHTPGRVVLWLRDSAALSHGYRGVGAVMTAAMEDRESARYSSCLALQDAGTRALERAQGAGVARADIDGTDLFAMAAALAWLYDQPSLAARAGHLFDVIFSGVLTRDVAVSPGPIREKERR